MGIGLTRARALAILGAEEHLSGDLRAAVALILERGPGESDCLGLGGLGQVELLRAGAEALGDDDLAACSQTLATKILADATNEARGWRCGLPMAVETPGFMLGLSGIGHGLLRQAAPERVPSLLALEAPR